MTSFFLTGALFAQTVYLTTSGSTATYGASGPAVVIDPNVSVLSGSFTGGLVDIASNFVSSEDRLIYPVVLHGITGSFNTTTGTLTLSGAGSASDYQDVFRSIQYQDISANPNTSTRTISFQVGTALAYAGTGHYYQYVASPGIRWDAAVTAAASTTYLGLQGYLVTITSAGENNFITQKINGNTWVGGTCDVTYAPGANFGTETWAWATGPERGTNIPATFLGGLKQASPYANWDTGEPNNNSFPISNGLYEGYMHLYASTGYWNDFAIDNAQIAGYLIEYGGMGEPSITVNGTDNVAISVTPPAPAIGATSTPTNSGFTSNWSSSTGATGYYLDVSTDAGFGSFVAGYNNRNVANVTSFPITGLSPATYYYWRLRAYNGSGISGNSSTGTALTLANAPTLNASSAYTNSGFTANWNASSGVIGGYYIDVATDAGFTSIVAGHNNQDVGNGTTYAVTGLSSGINYWWRLRAYNTSGSSGNSGTGTALTIPNPPALNLATTFTVSSFAANWTASVGAAGYYLDVATDAAFTSFVTGFNNKDVSNVTTYTVTGLSPATYYYWRLRANDASGTSSNSGTGNALTIPAPPVAVAPSSITTTGLAVNWNANAGVITGYYLDVATDAAFTSFVTNNVNVGNVTTSTVSGLTANTFLWYRVRAYNASGTGASSNTINTATLPNAPVATFAVPTQTTILANWNQSVGGATTYVIDISGSATFASFNSVNVGNVTSYTFPGLAPATTYYYRVHGENIGGAGAYSNTILVQTLVTVPPAPQANPALSVTLTSFTANWNSVDAVGQFPTAYYLDVSTNSNFSSFLSGYNNKDVGNLTSFTISNLSPNTVYYYRVRAYNAGGTGPNSNIMSVNTLPYPPATAPVALAATSITLTGFTANWGAVSGATGYYFDLATDAAFTNLVSGFNHKDVGNVTTYSINGLTPGVSYYYRVAAYNAGGAGIQSNTISAVLLHLPATPSIKPVTSVTSISFIANWGAVAEATGYDFDLATDSLFTNFVTSYNNKDVGNVTTYTVTGLSPNNQYYFRVRSYNANGSGVSSARTSAITTPGALILANPAVTNLTTNSFIAHWLAVTGAAGYDFDLATDSLFANFVTGYNNKDVGNVLLLAVTGLNPSTPYYFRVRAYGAGGSGTNSAKIAVTTAPVAPTLANPSVTNITPVSFTGNWSAVAGATGYYFDLSTDPAFATYVTGLNHKSVGNVTTYTVTGLQPNTQYYFRVSAINAAAVQGDESSIANATTLQNVAAILINIEPAPIQYLGKQSSVQVSNTIEVRDNIHAALASATISVAAGYNSAQDILTFTNQSGVTGTWDAVSGSMILKGSASPAVYQTLLRTIQYKNTSSTPTAYDRSISYTVNDGYDNSNIQSRTIKTVITGIKELSLGIPTEYTLYQNYPNPFNPTTKIRFAVPKESKVRVTVYNSLGAEVARLADGDFSAGYYEIPFNASKLSSGLYIYRISAGDFMQVKKMILMK